MRVRLRMWFRKCKLKHKYQRLNKIKLKYKEKEIIQSKYQIWMNSKFRQMKARKIAGIHLMMMPTIQ